MTYRSLVIRMVTSLCLFGFSLCIVTASAADASWPDVTLPPKSRVGLIGNDMSLNGVAMQVRQFEAAASAEEVLTFYRTHWGTTRESKSIENRINGWRIIGRREGRYYTTVQVSSIDATHSRGYLSVSRLPGYRDPARQQWIFPTMTGSEKLSDLRSSDPGKTAQSLVYINNFTANANVDFYRDRLVREGWQIDGEKQQNINRNNSQTLFFSQENREVAITVSSRSGKSGVTVIANIITQQAKL